MQLSTIDKMDFALNAIYKYKHRRVSYDTIINEIYGELNIVELGGCFDVLLEDGYIKEIVDEDVKAKLLEGGIFDKQARNHYTFVAMTMKGMLLRSEMDIADNSKEIKQPKI